jgi:N-acetylglucosaminyl-diphospho-decaprenol L-rhamnosyltransferase
VAQDYPLVVPVLVLNYNGRALLEACLPSILRAAAASRHDCRVCVIDNSSSDDSLAHLAERFPHVEVIIQPNRGLCSFNDVLAQWDCPVAVLLNNDVKLDERCLDPLIEPLLANSVAGSLRDPPSGHGGWHALSMDAKGVKVSANTPIASMLWDVPPKCVTRPHCFMTAPLCWRFDRRTYEGQKTAVRWRWGLVQATSLFSGHEDGIHTAGLTASAGAVLAVDRRIFLELGGFDPLYLPGRIEDLDFAFRGYMAGYIARYVPEAVAYHKGQGSFGPAFSTAGCDHLALRNTLLFQWKNLRHPWHLARQLAGLPLRLLRDIALAPLAKREHRFAFARALLGALRRVGQIRRAARPLGCVARERKYFRALHPRALCAAQCETPFLADRKRSPSRLPGLDPLDLGRFSCG